MIAFISKACYNKGIISRLSEQKGVLIMSEKRKDSKGRVLKTGESQRKDGRYQYRFVDNHGGRHTVYAATLPELRKKEQEITQKDAFHLDYTKGNVTVRELLEWYLDTKHNITHSTRSTYNILFQIVEHNSDILNLSINKVTTTDIRFFYRKMVKAGYATNTINGVHNCILFPAFSMACEDGIIARNPCQFKLDLPPKKQRDSLTVEQQRKLLELVKGDKKYAWMYDLIVILLNTGLRIGELLGLTIADIDMNKRVIHVDHQLRSFYDGKMVQVITKTKTDSSIRMIPITPPVYESLCRVIARRPMNASTLSFDGYKNFLFFTRSCTVRTPETIVYFMKVIRDTYNQTYPDDPIYLSAHVLRHTFCTNLINAGVNIKHVQYLMGHKNVETSLNIYTHSHHDDIMDQITQSMNDSYALLEAK